jgi:hypothetical protein
MLKELFLAGNAGAKHKSDRITLYQVMSLISL